MNRVPYCNECECCMLVDFMCNTYYCKHEDLEVAYHLGVDYIPKRSPKWCPKRKDG